jgi:hypothetical protein
MASTLIDRFNYTCPEDLFRAIISVVDEWWAENRKPTPGSDKYYMVGSEHVNTMLLGVKERWAQIKGMDFFKFPYNDKVTVEAWLSYRKEDEDAKLWLHESLGLPFLEPAG